MTIKIMGEALTNKIAAGEVVERPRSIVKELVENALDAGATEIKINLAQAGIQKITVSDNGTGMSEADASLAFVRHATSKIFDENDLFAIHTLGFRGEALAAVAAVSKVRLITGLVNEPATEIRMDGGVLTEQTTVDSKVGTTIEVSQLFYNTPARLKHLKSIQTEYSHTLEYLQKMALGRPDVRFELVHDDKIVFKTYGTSQLAETLVMIYGEKIADHLFAVAASDTDFTVSGMITHPQMQRSHNRVINLTINGRSIKHFGINHAILRGYGNLLPKGMFPIVALDIRLDVKLIDVNVHPAKLEVRISEEKALERLIEQMIKTTLIRENLMYKDVSRPRKIQTTEQLGFERTGGTPKMAQANESVVRVQQSTQLSSAEQDVATMVYQIPDTTVGQGLLQETGDITPVIPTSAPATDKVTVRSEPQTNAETTTTFAAARAELQALHVIGQFDATYILAQTDNTLFLIDQHAAQERIHYDEHMRQVRTMKRVMSQHLLFPLTLFLESREMHILGNHQPELARNGLDFEAFAEQEVRINAVPAWIKQENIETYVRKAIDCVVQYDTVDSALIREKELIMLSCRYSIKAHDVLNRAEMEALLQQLSNTETPFTCPHGRPTVIKHQLYEVQKWFKRV